MPKRKLDAPLKLKIKKLKHRGTSQFENPLTTTPEEFWTYIEQGVSSSFIKVKMQTLNKAYASINSGDIVLAENLFRALIIASYSPNTKIPTLIVQCLKKLFKTIEPFNFDKYPKSIQLFVDLIYVLLQTKYLIYFQASYEIFDIITTTDKFETISNKIFTDIFVKDITNKYKAALNNSKVIFDNPEGKSGVLKLHKAAILKRFVLFLLNKTIKLKLSTDGIMELLTNYLNGLYCYILEPSIETDKNTRQNISNFIETLRIIIEENKINNNDLNLVCKCIANKIEENNN